MKKRIPFAIAYDFDGTLAPGNMQERDFIPAIGMTTKTFWKEVSKECEQHKADNILIYMWLMLRKAEAMQVPVRKTDFIEIGKRLTFFDGILSYKEGRRIIDGWFNRVNEYGKQSGIDVQHYIVSSGIREMVEGSPIRKQFRAVFASSFCYDHHGVAKWPALALNYTSKTQYLFRINKGCLDVHKHDDINRFVPDRERAVPFPNMAYIGDGETDIPCFRLIKDGGGHSIAVYKPYTKGAKAKCDHLVKDGRVNFIAPADYRDGGTLDKIVKALMDKIAFDDHVSSLAPIQN